MRSHVQLVNLEKQREAWTQGDGSRGRALEARVREEDRCRGAAAAILALLGTEGDILPSLGTGVRGLGMCLQRGLVERRLELPCLDPRRWFWGPLGSLV